MSKRKKDQKPKRTYQSPFVPSPEHAAEVEERQAEVRAARRETARTKRERLNALTDDQRARNYARVRELRRRRGLPMRQMGEDRERLTFVRQPEPDREKPPDPPAGLPPSLAEQGQPGRAARIGAAAARQRRRR